MDRNGEIFCIVMQQDTALPLKAKLSLSLSLSLCQVLASTPDLWDVKSAFSSSSPSNRESLLLFSLRGPHFCKILWLLLAFCSKFRASLEHYCMSFLYFAHEVDIVFAGHSLTSDPWTAGLRSFLAGNFLGWRYTMTTEKREEEAVGPEVLALASALALTLTLALSMCVCESGGRSSK